MKSAVEYLDPTKVKLNVEVTHDELKPSLEQAYKDIAQQVSIPGFRKGKVPPRIINQRVGTGVVLEQAINSALPSFYSQAVAEADIRPLAQPSIEVTQFPELDSKDSENSQLVFSAEVEIVPDFDMPDLSDVELTVSAIEVSDEDLQAKVDELRTRFGTLIPVDRPAENGDFVTIDLKAEIDGEEIDAVTGTSYEVGSGNMIDGIDEALIGLSAGESTSFAAPLAGGEHAGKESTITVNVSQVKERELPELDEDFVQMASEFDTVDELKEDLRTQLAAEKGNDQAIEARDKLVEYLTENTDFPLPQGIIDDEVHRHLEQEGRLEDDVHRAEVDEDTKTSLRRQILLDELVKKYEVEVAQNELLDYLVSAAGQYGMEPGQFIQQISQTDQIPTIAAEVARSKALVTALRDMKVVDEVGNPVDLSAVLGTDEADNAPSDLVFDDSQEEAEAVAQGAEADAAADSVESADTPESADDDK